MVKNKKVKQNKQIKKKEPKKSQEDFFEKLKQEALSLKENKTLSEQELKSINDLAGTKFARQFEKKK